MTKFLIAGAFLAAVVASGLLHGRATGRWEPLPSLAPYLERLPNVPMVIGNWQGKDLPPLPDDEIAKARIEGNVYREYRNRTTGDSVTVHIVCGRTEPICAHTPDICFRGAGYVSNDEPKLVDVNVAGRRVQLWDMKFRHPNAIGQESEVHWTWFGEAGLESPTDPRFTFGRQPGIYKIYVIENRANLPGPKAKAKAQSPFLAEFIPALEASLAPPKS